MFKIILLGALVLCAFADYDPSIARKLAKACAISYEDPEKIAHWNCDLCKSADIDLELTSVTNH